MQQQQGFSIGRSQEINRDEIKFNKFIVRLRKKFSVLFSNALRVQLIAKGVITPDDWDDISYNLKYDYIEDNHYAELRDSEIMQSRMALLQIIDPYVGKYYSMEWAKKNVLMMDKDEMKDIDKQIDKEHKDQLALANMQGQLQVAQQQPMMAVQQAQAEQQTAMQQDMQDGQDQQAQSQEQQSDQSSDQKDAKQDTKEKGKVTRLKTGTWPN